MVMDGPVPPRFGGRVMAVPRQALPPADAALNQVLPERMRIPVYVMRSNASALTATRRPSRYPGGPAAVGLSPPAETAQTVRQSWP